MSFRWTAIHIHVALLPQDSPSRLPHNIEQSSRATQYVVVVYPS